MSPLYKYNDKLLIRNNALAISENCCCDAECVATVENILEPREGYGWTTTPTVGVNSIVGRFVFQDSFTCAGPNQFPQKGSWSCYFTLDQQSSVTLTVSGSLETQNKDFDYSWILLSSRGGSVIPVGLNSIDNVYPIEYTVLIKSTSTNGGCVPEYKTDSKTVTLDAGTYNISFNCDTIDSQWHQGMSTDFTVEWSAI